MTARFDTIRLEDLSPDRVGVSGVQGEPPPPTTKVCLNYDGGFRTTIALGLTGLDVEEKAALVERTLWAAVPGGKESFDDVDVQLIRTDHADPASNEAAVAQLRITVKDADERKVGRALSAKLTELALASYPGFFGVGGTGGPQAYGVYWPALVPADLVWQEVVLDGTRTIVESTLPPTTDPNLRAKGAGNGPLLHAGSEVVGGPTVRAPIGRVVGARSGDKGGNANLGVWARSEEAYRWLEGFLTVDRLQSLLAETRGLVVERYELANINAINFVIRALLGEGVASSSRLDAQAKGLGEYLRAKVVDVPVALLAS